MGQVEITGLASTELLLQPAASGVICKLGVRVDLGIITEDRSNKICKACSSGLLMVYTIHVHDLL